MSGKVDPDEYVLTDAQWLAVRPLFIGDEDDDTAGDGQ